VSDRIERPALEGHRGAVERGGLCRGAQLHVRGCGGSTAGPAAACGVTTPKVSRPPVTT
jgi:hypothetical protein